MLLTSRLRLHAEVKQLEADLKAAHEAYLSALKTRPDEAEGLAATGALSAVCNYLRAVGIEQRYWDSLLKVWGSFAPGRDLNETLKLADAAAAVTFLKDRAGRKHALKTVATAAGMHVDRLDTFRKNITASKPRASKAALDHYQQVLSEADQRLQSAADASGNLAQEIAEALLRGLREKNDTKV